MVGWFRRGSVKQQPALSSASGQIIGEQAAVVAPGFQAVSADARLYSASPHDSTCAAPVSSTIDRRVILCDRLPCVLWDLVTSDVQDVRNPLTDLNAQPASLCALYPFSTAGCMPDSRETHCNDGSLALRQLPPVALDRDRSCRNCAMLLVHGLNRSVASASAACWVHACLACGMHACCHPGRHWLCRSCTTSSL
jgi:hypothetical protein